MRLYRIRPSFSMDVAAFSRAATSIRMLFASLVGSLIGPKPAELSTILAVHREMRRRRSPHRPEETKTAWKQADGGFGGHMGAARRCACRAMPTAQDGRAVTIR